VRSEEGLAPSTTKPPSRRIRDRLSRRQRLKDKVDTAIRFASRLPDCETVGLGKEAPVEFNEPVPAWLILEVATHNQEEISWFLCIWRQGRNCRDLHLSPKD
jgi:hypothetical protein